MMNINKYKTPHDKIDAWCKWTNSESGCAICKFRQVDVAMKTTYLEELVDNPESSILPPILLCNKAICFNAWLHSTKEYER